jgi:ATP-binding protein involved in chromosome partitioning
MALTREAVLEVLGDITEPDLKQDIVSANLVEHLEVTGNSITVKVLTSNPAMHARKRMKEAVEFNLKRNFGDEVTITCETAAMASDAIKAQRKIFPEATAIMCFTSGNILR